jgi:hypothetical protein
MRVLVFMGVIAVFISVFFALFIMSSTFGSSVSCQRDAAGKNVCVINNADLIILGTLLSGVFVAISIAVAYLMLSVAMSKSSLSVGYNMSQKRGRCVE